MSNPCATCSRCCRSYIVSVCGYDVWLICTRDRLSPEQFLVICPQDEPRRDGFLLDATGPTFGLMLDKQGPLKATRPCVFLLRLGGGYDRCGIYDHRPVVCQAYPMALWRSEVAQRENVLCPPDSWPAAKVRHPAWRGALQRQRMHFDLYRQVVLRWNARVAARPERHFTPAEYYSYLLNVYDRLARLDGESGDEQIARVRDTWGNLPDAEYVPDAAPEGRREVNVRAGSCPWLDYLLRAKSIVDGYFPEVECQPLRLPVAVGAPAPGPRALPREPSLARR